MSKKGFQHVTQDVPPMKDLVVLVADKDAEATIKGILRRPQSIGIRPITFDCVTHNRHDPGCVTQAQNFLVSFCQSCRYALVILDHEGSGREEKLCREELEKEIVASLDTKYWQSGCVEAIVIDPELEAWVWSDSPHVASIMDWDKHARRQSIKEWVTQHKPDYWNLDDEKPIRPKETMEEILFQTHVPRSPSLFKKLAETVSLKRCDDPAYNKLINTLQSWFSPDLLSY